MTDDSGKKLSPVAAAFVLQWGELGASWGINRTVAQVHALLFLSERPLHAEEIAASLSVARSNVSTSLKELLGWGVVRRVHGLGDRRDHFQAMTDVWEMARVIAMERRRREIDPTVRAVGATLEAAAAAGDAELYARKRLEDLLRLMETLIGVCDKLERVPAPLLSRTLGAGDRLLRQLLPKRSRDSRKERPDA